MNKLFLATSLLFVSFTARGIEMGVNIGADKYWGGAYVFNDLIRRTLHADWHENITGTGGVVNTNGALTALATGYAWKGLAFNAPYIPSGNYTLLWDHSAASDVELTGANATLITDDAANGKRIYNIDVSAPYGVHHFQVRVNAPVAGNPDPHIILPDQESAFNSGEIFNPDFIDELEGFQLLRFMNIQCISVPDTLPCIVENPSDMITADTETWDENIPYYVAVNMAEKIGADAWINVHHRATDATMAAIATEVYNAWDGDIDIFIEWSNEVWNAIFYATHYAEEQGAIEYPGLTGQNAGSTYLGKRSIDLKNAFKTAFGEDASHIKLVVAGFSGSYPYISPDGENCFLNCRWVNNYNDIENEVDVMSIAGYIAGGLANKLSFWQKNGVDTWTDQQFYNRLVTGPEDSVPTLAESFELHKTVVLERMGRPDLPIYLYEAGHHLTTESDIGGIYETQILNYLDSTGTTGMDAVYQALIEMYIDEGISGAAMFIHNFANGGGLHFGHYPYTGGPKRPYVETVEAH